MTDYLCSTNTKPKLDIEKHTPKIILIKTQWDTISNHYDGYLILRNLIFEIFNQK